MSCPVHVCEGTLDGVATESTSLTWAIFRSFFTNFVEPPQGEVRRITLPRTRVNRGKSKGF